MKKLCVPYSWQWWKVLRILAAALGVLPHGQAEKLDSNASLEVTSAMKDQQLVQPNAEAYEKEVAQLRSHEPKEYDFDRAILSDVLRALATDANLNYVALSESLESESTLVTIHLKQAPFTALETVANAYGVALIFEGGVWHMRPFDDKKMIARNYRLKYNLTEEVDFGGGGGMTGAMGSTVGAGGGMGGSTSSMNSGYGGGGYGSGYGGGNGGYGGGGMGGGIGIGSTGIAVSKKADSIMENIKAILGIPTHGFHASVAGEVAVGEFDRSPLMVPLGSGVESDKAVEAAKSDEGADAAVAWNSDNNSFFVVATRQQHQWVEAYLTSLDKVQTLIGIEVKFFETTRDPKSQLGVDWSKTLDGGIALKGTGLETPPFDLNESLTKILAPQAVILSATDLDIRIQALNKDRESQFTSYPRVLTLNNRPVTIQSVVNQPVMASSASVTPGVGGTSTQSISYMPIGTSIVLVPKKLDEGRINMHVQVIVSMIVGSEIVGGNKYPVPATRVYQSQLQVENGYTIAIAGLDEALDSREGTGIPILSRIPIVGWAFKNRYRDRSKRSMMMFITPTLMDANGNGITEKPLSELPRYKGDLPRQAPQIYTDGSLRGGPAKLGDAILWVDREQRRLDRIIRERRAEQGHRQELSRLGDVVEALESYLPTCSQTLPAEKAELYHWQLQQLDAKVGNLKACYRKNALYGLGYDQTCAE